MTCCWNNPIGSDILELDLAVAQVAPIPQLTCCLASSIELATDSRSPDNPRENAEVGTVRAYSGGKTWQLLECAQRAAMSRCNVAVFEVGDMTREELIVRSSIRLAGR